jgi:hypothetical protein
VRRAILHGQQDTEYRALRLAIEFDDAPVIADYFCNQRQSKSGPRPFCRHEGIEKVALEMFGDARAIVLNLDHERQADALA